MSYYGRSLVPMADMELIEATARQLMTKHGVGRLQFEFDRAMNRMGATHSRMIEMPSGEIKHVPVKITLSRHYAELRPMDETVATIMHEIAHALTPGDGHGDRWKWKCIELGIQPTRCGAASARPEPKTHGKCSHCDYVYKINRLPLKVYICPNCTHLSQLERILVWYKQSKEVKTREMPDRYKATLNRYLTREKMNTNV